MICRIDMFITLFVFLIDLVHNAPFEEEDVQNQIANCNTNLDSANAFSDCSALVGTNWNCINSAPSRVGTDNHRHKVFMSCGESAPLFCCPVWAMIRCMLQQVKIHCNPQSGDQFHYQYRAVAFQPQIEKLQAQECSQFRFASTECDNVLRFIRDTSGLESAARKSGLYPFFFSNSSTQNRLAHIRSGNGASHLRPSGRLWVVSIVIMVALVICVFSSDQL